jgi:hypothetical protein
VLLRPKEEPIELRDVALTELSAPEARVMGSVDGSPVVAGSFFFGCEHPMSRNTVEPADAGDAGNIVRCRYPYNLTADREELGRAGLGRDSRAIGPANRPRSLVYSVLDDHVPPLRSVPIGSLT